MKIYQIDKKNKQYPMQLIEQMGSSAPATIYASGDPDILQYPKIGLICSNRCPGSIIIRTFDAIRDFHDMHVVMIGGFHSPMERDCLDLWLNGTQPVIFCPAKSLHNLPMGKTARKALATNRLLILTPFGNDVRRTTSRQAIFRNDMVAALSDVLFVPHASNNGKTWTTVHKAFQRNQRILSFEDETNKNLIESGAKVFQLDRIENFFD